MSHEVGDKVAVYNLETRDRQSLRAVTIPDSEGEIVAIEGDVVVATFTGEHDGKTYSLTEHFGPGLHNKNRLRSL